jgi:hypothetical protein
MGQSYYRNVIFATGRYPPAILVDALERVAAYPEQHWHHQANRIDFAQRYPAP